ncbi:MAG: tetratricopeptide repeat protein [Chlorobi bacterium]|nr:tetratricopeptide repeat protein [Chlorobiota bacterium]
MKKFPHIIFLFGLLAMVSCSSVKNTSKTVFQKSNGHKSTSVKGGDNSSLFIDANTQRILGNYNEAEKLFRKCIGIDPKDDASYFELSKLALMRNNGEEAIEMAAKAVELSPENTYYLVLYGNLLQSNEQYEESLKVFDRLSQLKPNNIDYLDNLAVSYIYAGKNEKAIETYDRIESKVGITEEFSLKKQSLYLQEGKVDKAGEEIEKLIAIFPTESRYYAILAEMYMANGMEDKALEAYQKIIELDPENPYIHITLADYYKKKGNPEKAFEELKIGFANPSLDIDTKVQILVAYYSVIELYNDAKDEAFELAEILIKTHPDDPKSYSIYGDFLYQAEQFEEARQAFRKVISLDSSKYAVWEQLIFIESELNDVDAMLSESLRAIELFPEQALLYLFAGNAYSQKKKWEESIKILEEGAGYVVNNIRMEEQFYSFLGDAYNQIKDDANSDKYYEKVLKLNPDNDYVLNNYAYFLSLRNKDLEKAAAMAKRAVELKPGTANQDTYGWVLYQMGNYDEAATMIKKAIDNDETASAVILEHYGDVLWKLDRKEEAIEYWEKAKTAGEGSGFLEKKVEDKKLYE